MDFSAKNLISVVQVLDLYSASVDIRAVGAVQVLDLTPTRSRVQVNLGMLPGDRRIVDLDGAVWVSPDGEDWVLSIDEKGCFLVTF